MKLRPRLDRLETALSASGTVMVYGELYPAELAALLLKAPAYRTRAEAAKLHRYHYEHDTGYRAISDRPIPIRALELMAAEFVRRDFVTRDGDEAIPGEVARELLARPDASLAAKEQARRYLAGGER